MVIIQGSQPSSLPSRIPTTAESITAEQIERSITATDSEDALKSALAVRPSVERGAGIDNLNNSQHWNFHPYPQRSWAVALKFDL